jgi:hypothetical protein
LASNHGFDWLIGVASQVRLSLLNEHVCEHALSERSFYYYSTSHQVLMIPDNFEKQTKDHFFDGTSTIRVSQS